MKEVSEMNVKWLVFFKKINLLFILKGKQTNRWKESYYLTFLFFTSLILYKKNLSYVETL